MSGLPAIDLGGVQANCQFFAEEEIEFDIDPREVQTEQTVGRLSEVTGRISDLLQARCS